MPYSKRQIIEINFTVNGRKEPHPGVILFIDDVYNAESFYLCAMISSSEREDAFTFKLFDDDLTHPLPKVSQVRSHLIFQAFDEDILGDAPTQFMKEEPFNRLIDHIDEVVFNVPFPDL